jgi:hypothetical protein
MLIASISYLNCFINYLNCFIKKTDVLIILKIYFANSMHKTTTTTNDLIEQGIEALIQAQKAKDPDKLQRLVCTLETIATTLRNRHE